MFFTFTKKKLVEILYLTIKINLIIGKNTTVQNSSKLRKKDNMN